MSTIGTMTDYLENKLINHLLRATRFTPPSSVYVGLYTVSPSDIREGTEVSSSGYLRVSAAFTITGNYAANTSAILFPIAIEDWGTIVGVGIFDEISYGNLLFWGDIDNHIEINASEQYIINIGMLNIELKGSANGGWGISTANSILKHVLANTEFSSPGENVYMALGNSLLYDEDYNFSSSGSAWTETTTSGTTYSRKKIGGASNWYAPSSGSTTNLNQILYANPPLGTDWGAISHIVFFDAVSSGSVLLWGKLYAPIWIIAGDGLQFASGNVDISLN